jgi:hypothetical protein
MATPKHDDAVAEIIKDPFSKYDTPMAVVDDDRLSIDQKRRVLNAMKQDARDLATAADENMTGGETNQLGRILEAKRKLPE